ncbi:DUF5753 domain-containing protein [Streptomyces bobili]|uniref:DUF5753 domain-containing protein n=1 Tax=Streptomyces bobili TaxID=67280 RepID=UPI0037916A16
MTYGHPCSPDGQRPGPPDRGEGRPGNPPPYCRRSAWRRPLTGPDIPGLFQTEEYMRAVFTLSAPQLSDAERELQIQHRLQRQQLIEPEARVPQEAIIHESALRMRFGGRKAARAQLDRVLELAHRDDISVRVVTYDAEGFAGLGSPVMYACSAVPQLDTVQLDALHGVLFLDAEAQLAWYRLLLALIHSLKTE